MSERDIFLSAIELTGDARCAFLDKACAADVELRRKVEALFAAHEQAGNFLHQPAVEATSAFTPGERRAARRTDSEVDQLPGTVLAGRYKLLERIGLGGMGAVYVAEQTQPVRRKVAVKIIKLGMDTGQVLARFDAERQALAMMDHPNIAKVLDGGMTDDHRPFFVMEYVKGDPLHEFCDTQQLTVKHRLDLFIQICQAVQHAHQKGIIHRDLKPNNILVCLYDGKPVPKVIDFGLAKALHQPLTEHTLHTGHGMVLGTPLYMSPEQAEVNNFDVDTRTDIYALGVILYELLTGTTPLEKQRFRKAAWDEVLRIIREEEPPKPSTKLSGSNQLASLSAQRKLEPRQLTQLLSGDLDWIVMKALEKDRNRRYETANGFAMDVQRYLADEPVSAGPPGAGYRLRKFVRRNRGKVLAAGIFLGLLIAGIAGTTFGLIRANHSAEAERLANIAAQDERTKAVQAAAAEKTAHQQAQKRLTQIEKANDLLGSIFENLDPKEIAKAERPLQAILVEKLDKAVAELEGESIGDPLVVAAMQHNFGISLLGLGEPGKATVLLEKACATRQAKLGPEHLDTLKSMINLAKAYRTAGKLGLALSLSEETLRLIKAKLGPEHRDTLTSMSNLASAYHEAGKLDLALPLYEQTLKLQTAILGPDHVNTLQSMHNLAVTYQAAGKRDLALALKEQTLKLEKDKFGLEHPYTLTGMNNLALAYQAAGKWDLALPLLEETHRLTQAKLGREHPNSLITMGNLAGAYQNAGKLNLAIPLHEETLKLRKAKLGPEHPNTLVSMNALAWAYQVAGKLDLAIPLNEETQRLMQAKLGPGHPTTLTNLGNLGTAYCDANQGEKATATLKKFVAGERKRAKPDDLQFAAILAQVALDLLKCKQHATAEEMLRECLAMRAKTQPDEWTTFNTMSMLGGALLGQKKYAEAEPLLLKGYEGMRVRFEKAPGASSGADAARLAIQTRLTEALERLIQFYMETSKPEEAKNWQAEKAKLPKPVEKK